MTHTNKPALQASCADIVRCFGAAVHNAADINTVPCDYAVYNSTGLLKQAVPCYIQKKNLDFRRKMCYNEK